MAQNGWAERHAAELLGVNVLTKYPIRQRQETISPKVYNKDKLKNFTNTMCDIMDSNNIIPI
jgi:hypothetical protein